MVTSTAAIVWGEQQQQQVVKEFLRMAALQAPKFVPFPGDPGLRPPLNTRFLGATRVHTPHDIIFSIAGREYVSICKNRALL